MQFENKKKPGNPVSANHLLPTLIHQYHMYHRDISLSLDLLFLLILKPKFDPVIIICLSCEDDFASLRAGILQVDSKEIRLRTKP